MCLYLGIVGTRTNGSDTFPNVMCRKGRCWKLVARKCVPACLRDLLISDIISLDKHASTFKLWNLFTILFTRYLSVQNFMSTNPQITVFDAYSVQLTRALAPSLASLAPPPSPVYNEDTPCRGENPRITSGRRGPRVGVPQGPPPLQQPTPASQQTLSYGSRSPQPSGSGSAGQQPLLGMQPLSWATNAPLATYGGHAQQQQQQQAPYGYGGMGSSAGFSFAAGNSGARGSAVPAARAGTKTEVRTKRLGNI